MDTRKQAPVAASTLAALHDAIADRRASAASVAAVVDTDPGLLSRVLALANSAFFGMARRVADSHRAVSLVGAETVRTLAIVGLTGLLDGGLPDGREHALAAAAAARRLAPVAGVPVGEAFTAALLHDLGELLLWQDRGERYLTLRADAGDDAHQLQLERLVIGVDHAELGAQHLAEWRLPDRVVAAVRDHHTVTDDAPPLTLVTAAAHQLAMPSGARPALAALGHDEATVTTLRAEVEVDAMALGELLAA